MPRGGRILRTSRQLHALDGVTRSIHDFSPLSDPLTGCQHEYEYNEYQLGRTDFVHFNLLWAEILVG